MAGIFDTDLLRVLSLIQETGSISAAAERLGVTQQAVSAQLKRIESTVGRRLIERGGGQTAVNADGLAIIAYGREASAIKDRMRRHFSTDVLVGCVSVGIIEGFASTVLPTVLAAFRSQQPRLEIIVETGLTKRMLSRLESGNLDMVLGLQKAGQIHGEVIWQDRLRWMGDPQLFGDPKLPLQLVLPPEPAIFRSVAIDALAGCGRPFVVTFESGSQISRHAAMLSGLGLGVSCELLEGAMASEIEWVEGLPELGDVEFFIRIDQVRDPAVAALADILRRTARQVLPPFPSAAR